MSGDDDPEHDRGQDDDESECPCDKRKARQNQVRFYASLIAAGLAGAASLGELVRTLW